MSVVPLVAELVIVFCIALLLLHYYGNVKRQHPIVTLATLTAWYFSLIIIFVLPLDVSSSFYNSCKDVNTSVMGNVTPAAITCVEPWSSTPDGTLPALWRVVYWTSQALTWVVLPFMQSYSVSGQFSSLGKMKDSLIRNAIYYGTYLLIVVILLIYVAASPNIALDFSRLKVICITASNTWGMFLLILLLGYGLVEVPRSAWRAGNPLLTRAHTYFQLAKLSTEKQEAIENMDDLLVEIEKAAEIVRYNHPLRKFLDVIIAKCPDEFKEKMKNGMNDFVRYGDDGSESTINEKYLVHLHTKLLRVVDTKLRTNIQWKILMNRALQLNTVISNLNKPNVWVSNVNTPQGTSCCNSYAKWQWECKVKPVLFKSLAVCLIILSLMVIWSECTFFKEEPVLSLFAIFIKLLKTSESYFCMEIVCSAIISYLCVCAYYTVFRMKIFNIYYIAGHHQTNEPSIMFVGIMLCRLTPPLCLNFLGLIHLDAHISTISNSETSYTKIMGHLDFIPIIANGFNIYFPILVVVLCFATYFRLGHRCLSALGFQQFIDGDEGDEFTADLIEEGRRLVSREERRLELDFKKTTKPQLSHDISTRQWQGRFMRESEKWNQAMENSSDRTALLDSPSENSPSDFMNEPRTSQPSSSYGASTKRFPTGIFDDI